MPFTSPGDEDFLYLVFLIHTTDFRMDDGIALGFDINESPVCRVKGNNGVLPPFVAEQDKGTLQARHLSIIIYLGGEVAALILIKNKLVAAGEVLKNKILELLEGRVFECKSLAIGVYTLTGDGRSRTSLIYTEGWHCRRSGNHADCFLHRAVIAGTRRPPEGEKQYA